MECHEAIDVMGDALEGGLGGQARAGFDEHLAECSACRTYFDQLRLTRDLLRRLPRRAEGGARRSKVIETFRKEFEP